MYYIIAYFFIITAIYGYLFASYLKGWKSTSSKNSNYLEPSSYFTIIIPARNEEENIKICIQSILNNQYSKSNYEILVIDDFSEDQTAAIVKELSTIHNSLRLIQLSDYISKEKRINAYKKQALNIGISQAQYPWIITTDADCILPKNWLDEFNLFIHHHPEAKMIAAPVSFLPPKDPKLLYYFQSIDFLTMQGITAASITLNLGSMANGANLAFDKNVFKEVKGYDGIDHIASGDDMLLMQKIKEIYPTGIYYLKQQNSIVSTYAQNTIKEFLNQRIRWASKSGAYQEQSLKMTLLVVYIFNLSILFLFFASLFNSSFILVFCAVLFLKIIIELIFINKITQFFNKKSELKYYPFLQIFHIPYIVLAGFLGLFGTYEWKGRKVK